MAAELIDEQSAMREMGLDLPLPVQFGSYLLHLAEGDFGTSYVQRSPVSRLLLMLTVAGYVMRTGMPGIIMIPGMLFLTAALLAPVGPEQEASPQRRALERELASYSTPAQRRDLDAILDRYPDGDTIELRNILARQPAPAEPARVPAPRWH